MTLEIRSGYAHHGDIELHYEDLGDINNPPVLLIMGLGAQLVLWHNEFCQKLIDLGYRVIRYDNRDVGLSSKLHDKRQGGLLVPKLLRGLLACVAHVSTISTIWLRMPLRSSITWVSNAPTSSGRRWAG